MSRTKRYCNRKHKTTNFYFHIYKFRRSYCRCDYCVDDHASKHRRDKFKTDIRRELINLCPYNSLLNKILFYFL